VTCCWVTCCARTPTGSSRWADAMAWRPGLRLNSWSDGTRSRNPHPLPLPPPHLRACGAYMRDFRAGDKLILIHRLSVTVALNLLGELRTGDSGNGEMANTGVEQRDVLYCLPICLSPNRRLFSLTQRSQISSRWGTVIHIIHLRMADLPHTPPHRVRKTLRTRRGTLHCTTALRTREPHRCAGRRRKAGCARHALAALNCAGVSFFGQTLRCCAFSCFPPLKHLLPQITRILWALKQATGRA